MRNTSIWCPVSQLCDRRLELDEVVQVYLIQWTLTVCAMYRTWGGKLRWGLLRGQTVHSVGRSPGRKSSSRCHQRRRNGGPDPKHTSCPTKTERERERWAIVIMQWICFQLKIKTIWKSFFTTWIMKKWQTLNVQLLYLNDELDLSCLCILCY